MGVRFVFPDFLEKDEPTLDFKIEGYKSVTSTEMELKAAVIALQKAAKLPEVKERKVTRIIICTDSQFMTDNYLNACMTWPKTGWRTKNGSPVINASLWKELVKAAKKVGVRVDFTKVKGHSSDLDNRVVDALADQSAKRARRELIKGRMVRRRLTSQRTRRGLIPMLGQEITIRIIDSRFLHEHNESQLRYEVVEEDNEFLGSVDLVFSKKTLRPGHVYRVRFNEDSKYPQIKELLEEIEKGQ